MWLICVVRFAVSLISLQCPKRAERVVMHLVGTVFFNKTVSFNNYVG